MHILPERLKQRRKELKLSQDQLAIMANITRTQILRYEHGENEPSAEITLILARALGVSTDWLIGLDDTPQPPLFADLEKAEQRLVNIYRTKTPDSQKRLLEMIKVV